MGGMTLDWEWFWIVVLTVIVCFHGLLDIFFVRWVLWRNKLLTNLAVKSALAESESLSSETEQE
jgi:hypothetical protein|tara:strand:- start:923 stop:1114 length:192 start_codon:yes stop_codon:yes gene_type:complete